MLAEGHMWKQMARGGAGKESMARGESLIKEVMADLKMLTNYELELTDPLGSVIPDMSDTAYRVLCNTTNYTPTFDEGDELQWVIDPDKLTDIEDAK
jgi:hypothetical protein